MRAARKGAISLSHKQQGFRFPKVARLKSKKDFLEVRQRGERVASVNFTLHWIKRVETLNSSPISNEIRRLGISFYPRTRRAVVRNRVKRVFREIFRREFSKLLPGVDLQISVRPKERLQEVKYAPLREEFILVCRKASIWMEESA